MHKYKHSDHFDGKKFFNPDFTKRNLKALLKWVWTRKPPRFPKIKPLLHKELPPKRLDSSKLRVTFIGHSTVLIQFAGLNILTDPVWSSRAGPLNKIGPRRMRRPGLKIKDLPEIDLILLSHNHYDHMDLPTLKRLNKRFHPQIITGLGNGKKLLSIGFKDISELDWWDGMTLDSGLKVTFVPAKHFSGRTPFDYNKTLWGAFVLEFAGKTIFFAADTGYSTHFKEIKERFKKIDLSFLPIGAFRPSFLMKPVHMSPNDAIMAHRDLQTLHTIAIHFGTFKLGDEEYDEYSRAIRSAECENKLKPSSFLMFQEGEGRDF